jgi:hypothetical protein
LGDITIEECEDERKEPQSSGRDNRLFKPERKEAGTGRIEKDWQEAQPRREQRPQRRNTVVWWLALD